MTDAEASRFLVQSTFGPNMAEIQRVKQIGMDAWLSQQFNTPSMDTHWNYVAVRGGPLGKPPLPEQGSSVNDIMESFWMQAIQGPDQLRQRTAWAYSQIFVISMFNSSLEINGDAVASYHDMLSRNAFGNYRTLIEQVSTHPAMGRYLSHIQNMKENPATGRLPDENYAREVMQLFSIGLWELNQDGTRRKDPFGNDIPTYDRTDVNGMAKVFTGWSWNSSANSFQWGFESAAWNRPMRNFPEYHSTSEKRLLGTTIPAGTSGEESLRIAMDTLSNHPNVGPFIGKQLIQRLVTSNPSPAYVARVSRAFANNGNGVRGDMKAVIRAVLMDPEARDPRKLNDPNWGKVREPALRLGAWLRAFDVQPGTGGDYLGRYAIWNLENPTDSLGQNPFRAPSVFNWYRPGYAPPGEILERGLTAPEFQIIHATTAASYVNFLQIVDGFGYNEGKMLPKNNYARERALADNPEALLDHLNVLLVAGQMSATTRNTILPAVNAIPAENAIDRVKTAIVLTMASPDFIVQK
jgi:uncharacterized protein (DUF1800 family)